VDLVLLFVRVDLLAVIDLNCKIERLVLDLLALHVGLPSR
jgi:hypothetical protein